MQMVCYDTLTELTQVQTGSTTTSYTYDANGNRATMQTSAGTTSYSYDSADVELTSKTDPNGKVTTYTYDANGNLTQSVYDPSGANQKTTYSYDKNNRLTGVTEANGTNVTFSYDADGNRVSKVVTSGSTTTTITDVYALGHLDHQTDQNGTILATFTYDTTGEPTSVVVGAPTTGTRYYYVYNGHGDVVALVDSNGTAVASYAYDEFGNLTSSSESFPNGWHNPYRYDGRDHVRYDTETGLYWMSVRAYDPTLGRFLSHDPLGRLAAWGMDTQPYIYVSNNPVNKTDPSGMLPGRLVDGGSPNPNGCQVGVYTSGCPAPTGFNAAQGGRWRASKHSTPNRGLQGHGGPIPPPPGGSDHGHDEISLPIDFCIAGGLLAIESAFIAFVPIASSFQVFSAASCTHAVYFQEISLALQRSFSGPTGQWIETPGTTKHGLPCEEVYFCAGPALMGDIRPGIWYRIRLFYKVCTGPKEEECKNADGYSRPFNDLGFR